MANVKIVALAFVAIVFAFLALQTSIERLEEELKGFDSPQEFMEYASRTYEWSPMFFHEVQISGAPLMSIPSTPLTSKDAEIERFSATNVQVIGIDEPDVVKTDGEKMYLSQLRTSLTIKIHSSSLSLLSQDNRFKSFSTG